tara:strand:- start:48 stop:974 length:927 start_codon:yes stop_codon:yes gene_type:complete
MKKLLGIVVLGLLISVNVYAKNTKLVKGNSYQEKIKWQHLVYKLPEGKWKFLNKTHFSLETIRLNCIEFLQAENNNFKGAYSICEVSSGGKYHAELGMILSNGLKKGKHDNCTLRPEYFFAKLWTKGMSMNCFRTRHLDIDKELNYPDDPEAKNTLYIKEYIKDNNLELPKILLQSMHVFYSPNIRDKGIEISHSINPELYGVPKTINGQETQSEYHRNNIKNHPIKNQFMIDWTQKKAIEHGYFEKYMKVKNHQKLDLGKFLKNMTKKSNTSDNKDFIDQINQLNNLYKSGSLTKEEFEKAKKKILN